MTCRSKSLLGHLQVDIPDHVFGTQAADALSVKEAVAVEMDQSTLPQTLAVEAVFVQSHSCDDDNHEPHHPMMTRNPNQTQLVHMAPRATWR